jgi:hypothetical protein
MVSNIHVEDIEAKIIGVSAISKTADFFMKKCRKKPKTGLKQDWKTFPRRKREE